MGLGEAMMEEQVYRPGKSDIGGLHKNPSKLDYKSPTSLDMPEIETILVETNDPEGPYGAKEAGQGPLLPVMPAIANAIYNAVGVRVDEVPITPDKIYKGLQNIKVIDASIMPDCIRANTNATTMMIAERMMDLI